jgi:hypothetical protein
MKKFLTTLLLFLSGAVALSQERAAVQMDNPNTRFHPGDPIAFQVKLNEPLPNGADFQIRISPMKGNREIALASDKPEDTTRMLFVVRGSLPKEAVSGEWGINVIYLFLPGTGWTSSTIQPTVPVKFVVEGKEFAIPTTAQIAVTR